MKNGHRLIVVIVNYKTSKLVCNMLTMLTEQLNSASDRVCIVDNNSGDGSAQRLNDYVADNQLDHYVEVIASEHNGGFSFGNNLAVRSTLEDPENCPEFFLLLNPDTEVTETAIPALLDFMEQHPEAGIAGSRLEEPDGTVQTSSFRFHTLASELDSSMRLGVLSRLLAKWQVSPEVPTKNSLTDWVAGASMMVRSQVFKDVGLMDEHFFLYFEETDFCLQAKKSGWECWYVPSSRVVHLVGQSTGVKSADSLRVRRPTYWFESRQYYFVKNYGLLYTMLADLIWGTGFAIWRLRRLLQNKSDTDPEKMLSDFWRNSIFLKNVMKRRNS